MPSKDTMNVPLGGFFVLNWMLYKERRKDYARDKLFRFAPKDILGLFTNPSKLIYKKTKQR